MSFVNVTCCPDLKSRLDTLDERLAVQSLDLDAMQRQLRLSDNSTVPSVGKVSSKQHESNRGQVSRNDVIV